MGGPVAYEWRTRFTLAAVLTEIWPRVAAVPGLRYAAAAAVLGPILWVQPRLARDPRGGLFLFALYMTAMPLVSPVSETHHLAVLAGPLWIWLLAAGSPPHMPVLDGVGAALALGGHWLGIAFAGPAAGAAGLPVRRRGAARALRGPAPAKHPGDPRRSGAGDRGGGPGVRDPARSREEQRGPVALDTPRPLRPPSPLGELMATKTLRVETVAQAYLELLRDRGIDCFFANAGTDFASIVDAFARFETEGKTTPRPIAVPHEFVAVSMAHGYYLVTGRPQAVMVHVTVGTANGIGAVINASRTQVPVLFTAGRTPITEEGGLPGARDTHIHWAQESFDQAGMLREYVKWDYELRQPVQLEAVVDRALELAMAEPRGPVYLTLPREVLAQPLGELTISSPARRQVESRRFPDPARIEEAAERLVAAPEPADRHRRAGARAAGGGRAGRARRRRRLPGARVEPRVRELPGGPSVPRRLGLREPGLPGDGRGRRRARDRLRRALVPVALAARRRRHRDPARRRSVLLPVSDALLSLRRPARRRAGGGAAASRRGGPASRRPRRRGGAAGAARRGAPGAPRELGQGRPGGARSHADRLPVGLPVRRRGARLRHDRRQRVPAGSPSRPAVGTRGLLRLAPLRGARLGPGGRARREARGAGEDRHRHGRGRGLHLRGSDGRPPGGAAPQAAVPDGDLQQRRRGRPSSAPRAPCIPTAGRRRPRRSP